MKMNTNVVCLVFAVFCQLYIVKVQSSKRFNLTFYFLSIICANSHDLTIVYVTHLHLFSAISNTCLRCIRSVESRCNANTHRGDGGRSCGPYQIQYNYWIDGGRQGRRYRRCVGNSACVKKTIKGKRTSRYLFFSYQWFAGYICCDTQ